MYTEAWVNAETGKVIIRKPYKVIDWTLPNKGEYDVTASNKRRIRYLPLLW